MPSVFSRYEAAVACFRSATDFPLRRELADEVHARPFLRIDAPARVTHLAIYDPGGDEGVDAHFPLIHELCLALGIPRPAAGDRHYNHREEGFQLKWERHIEFSTFTFVSTWPDGAPFQEEAGVALGDAWAAALRERRLTALRIEVLKGPAAVAAQQNPRQWFDGQALVGSRGLGGGEGWCDWQIRPDGLSRFLVLDLDFRENQVGRLVQRLAEIETYRLMALLALPIARDMERDLNELERDLAQVMRRMEADQSAAEDSRLLFDLTTLAGRNEVLSGLGNRFSASQAYDRIVVARIQELREERIEGVPTIGEFMERRLSPAMDTCRSVQARQASLALRVSRAIDLLRTRVNLAQEHQVTGLLDGMNRTARTQLKLQHAVEGFSVVAISYYAISLLGHALGVLHEAGLQFNATLVEGALIPVVVGLAAVSVRGAKRQSGSETASVGGAEKAWPL